MGFTRREFIQTTGMGAGSLMIPGFLHSPFYKPSYKGVRDYLEHFNVSEELLQKVISMALSFGGDYADLYFEHSMYNNLSLQDKKVNRAGSYVDYGVGIRVLKGDQTGYAYSESLDEKSMIEAAKTAGSIANDNKWYKPVAIHENFKSDYYRIEKKWEEITVAHKVPIIEKLDNKIFDADEKVIKVNAFLNDSTSYILFYNSEGLMTADYRPMISLGVTTIMQRGEQKENSYTARSFRKGFEFLTEELIDEVTKETIKRTNLQFEAVKPKGGEMPVVMGAGGSGILLHEAIGHTFEADFNRKGTSIFSDKYGQKIAEPFINIVDDGTILNNRGSINIDDEGIEGQKTYLVRNGILNSYIHDRISAKHYEVKPTGNGRRESFRYAPVPRMRATYMENAHYSREELFEQVDYGVYVDNFSNGEVKIGAGDFTFFVKSGYIIENGKLTKPIKDINIIGNGPQALADISLVSNDFAIDNGTWTCGKAGQSVPVTCGLPSVLVKKLTVGGV